MFKPLPPQILSDTCNAFCLKVIITFIALIFFTCACDKKTESDKANLEEIHFTVNQNLLGNKIIYDDLFEFYVPKLLIIQESDFTRLEDQLNSFLNDSIKISLLYVFTDSSKENSLSVGRIILDDEIFIDPIDYYSKVIGSTDLFKSSSKAKFLKNGLLISQFITNHNNHIIIKIIFQPKENYLIQLDYIFNEENYKQEVRSIESSIGSIKIL